MLRKRFRKYRHIAGAVVKQEEALRKLEAHPATDIVKKAFFHVKKGNYGKEDQLKLNQLAKYTKELKANQTEISYEFFGIDQKRTVSQIAQNAGSPKKWCEFFYFLTKFSEAKKVLEIGTNLGISGQYFLSALPSENSRFTTLEGVPGLCELASERFGKLAEVSRFDVVQGLYDSTLPGISASGEKFDLVFFDGNHKYGPTINYFEILKQNYSQNAILVFDDIYWNKEMEEAWRHLREEPGVYCSIDFFKLGILLFDSGKKDLPKHRLKLFLAF